MKTVKTFILLFLVGLFATPLLKEAQCQAQVTRYYIYQFTIDNNGVKTKLANKAGKGTYLTFAGDIVYISDKNGYKLQNPTGLIWDESRYIGMRNNKEVYRCLWRGAIADWFDKYFLYFTSDYSRLNFIYGGGWTDVWEEGLPGDEVQTPNTFY